MKVVKTLSLSLLLAFQAVSLTGQTNEYNVIPKPQQLKPASGEFTFNAQTRLSAPASVAPAFDWFKERLQTAAGIDLKAGNASSNAIVCKINAQVPAEGYRMQIGSNKITIEASRPVGFFYASQTLRQLLPAVIESTVKQDGIRWTVPCCRIEDAPRYAYRGMMLDCSRHFSTKEEVMNYIDQLALLKMNTFHWHLTDDQGWRIEIKQYPKLTTIGGFRSRTLEGHYEGNPMKRKWIMERHGGFYTQEEIKEIVAYAQKRYINVMPEIEMPGHAMAALAAYPNLSCTGGPFEVEGLWGVFNDVYCPNDSTIKFLQNVLTEVAALFPYPYIHIGGDECPKLRWHHCHACQERIEKEGLKNEHELQAWFVGRMAQFLHTLNKKLVGWDEILEGGLLEKDKDATIMSWRGVDGAIAAARSAHDAIISPNATLYLDHYQSKDTENEPISIGGFTPLSEVYEFNPTPTELTAAESKHILGVQGNVWTEYMLNQKHREYMIFPRLLALSEIAWLQNDKKDYNQFKTRVEAMMSRYDILGINYCKAFLTQ